MLAPTSTLSLKAYAATAAGQYGVPFGILDNVLTRESGYNPFAYNAASGAGGIAQVLASTARDPGYGISPLLDRTNPIASIDFASQYLKAMYDRLGNWNDATLAYTKGLGYALTNRGETAYQPLGASVTDGGKASPTANDASGTGSVEQASWFGCDGWLSTPVACGQELAARGGLIALGLIVVGLGIWVIIRRM